MRRNPGRVHSAAGLSTIFKEPLVVGRPVAHEKALGLFCDSASQPQPLLM